MEAFDVIVRLLATLSIGVACGLLLKKTKFPAAYMVGAFVGVAVFNCATESAFLPDGTRMGIQIVAGAFAGSIIVVLILKLGFDFASVPKQLKKICQLVAGCYLGTLFTFDELLSMGYLVLPVLVIVAGYTLNCFLCGWLESRLFGYGRREGMLIASPAGASDMALIIDDMGIANTDIAILQVIRATVVMTTFPQIVNIICFFIGG